MSATTTAPSERRARRSARTMAGFLTGMGVLHFVKPEPFDSLIPGWVPGSARFWTYASGVAELATAALLAVPRTRRTGGAVASALFVAVFPGNVEMARQWRDRPAHLQAISLGRLPLQALLVAQAEDIRRNG
ncbi:hypothetical protein [Arsenicicoccus dermatophilus]|uniref:DoxX family protein n=1 Tax=Arsenicicoccus dermatophilus TaxID=1076331 RepID=UPI003917053C